MSTPVLINSGTVFNNANGSIVVTLPETPTLVVNTAALTANATANLVNITVLSGVSGTGKLKDLKDVSISGEEAGYVLTVNDGGTPLDPTDDTYDFVKNDLDGGSF